MSLKYTIIALLYNNIVLNLKYYTFLYLYDEKVYHIKSPRSADSAKYIITLHYYLKSAQIFQDMPLKYTIIALLYNNTVLNFKYYTFLDLCDEKVYYIKFPAPRIPQNILLHYIIILNLHRSSKICL